MHDADQKDTLFSDLEQGLDPVKYRVLDGDHDTCYIKNLTTGAHFKISVEILDD
ncbi:MAG: hypothetical protein NC311_10125 [Muribaculaceae bacterium]|nr:hypothetical protein [Muribaculaceae bacterium]